MNTISAGLTTNPFIAKYDNSAGSSSVKLDTDFFDNIDKKAATRIDDTVNFSSKAQFMLNLQAHAHTLSGEERNKFADALEQSGDEIFDEKFIQWLKDPPSTEDYKFTVDPELEARTNSMGLITGSRVENPSGIIVNYSGPTLIGQWNFNELSSSNDIHETDHLTRKLDKLTTKASKELSSQDLATITGTMSRAVEASRNNLDSSYALFRTNFDYEVAEQAISKLPMSDELKGEYSTLLSDTRSFQSQRINEYIDQQEGKIQSSPQFSNTIREEIQALEEGLEINKELQQSIAHSKNGLLGEVNHFQKLIRNAEFIEQNSSDQISDIFDHFTKQLGEFDRLFIEKDWGQNSSQQTQSRDPVLDLAFEETEKLTHQYIAAINSYLANQSTSGT